MSVPFFPQWKMVQGLSGPTKAGERSEVFGATLVAEGLGIGDFSLSLSIYIEKTRFSIRLAMKARLSAHVRTFCRRWKLKVYTHYSRYSLELMWKWMAWPIGRPSSEDQTGVVCSTSVLVPGSVRDVNLPWIQRGVLTQSHLQYVEFGQLGRRGQSSDSTPGRTDRIGWGRSRSRNGSIPRRSVKRRPTGPEPNPDWFGSGPLQRIRVRPVLRRVQRLVNDVSKQTQQVY